MPSVDSSAGIKRRSRHRSYKSDVYFFSSRLQTNQRWGTAQPVTVRDKDFGAIRLRAFGIYSWRLTDPRTFHTKVSGTKELYRVEDIEGQLRNTIVGRMSDTFAESQVPFLDMAANQIELGQRIAEHLRPSFAELGLTLDSFVVENLSLPEELQKRLDQRIGMNMIGDMGKYTQFQVAESLPIAAANEGGGLAGAGVGIGAGFTMAQQMMNAMRPDQSGGPAPQTPPPPAAPPPAGPSALVELRRIAGGGDEVLFQLRQVDPQKGQVLPGMRNAAVAVGKYRGGCEWVVEAHGCDESALCDVARLQSVFSGLSRK